VKVLFTDPAEGDLEDIGDWIADNNPLRAATFVGELRQACLQIGPRPNAYPIVEHRKSDGLRRRVYGNYLIFYRVTDDAAEIIHVLHGARDYAEIIFPDDPN
jgi:plasmid stabilization system protein ParE